MDRISRRRKPGPAAIGHRTVWRLRPMDGCGPCSTSHSRPSGANARPYGVRWPLVQVSDGARFGPSTAYVLITGAVFAGSVSHGGLISGRLLAPTLPAIG